MDNEQPHQELVKCVVVGDTAVGKTRLICARACNAHLTLSQLMNTHIPTVWAIDQYRIYKEVLERSWEVVDGVNVSLRLWDTFGDHEKDRRFAYGRSDVVLLCFSVANPVSLRNCKVVWYPEIRRFCPNTPIILVGCKNDLRFMYRDEQFLALCRDRSPFFRGSHPCVSCRFPEFGRPLKESDILTPEQGRAIAKEIGAPYYETSVLTHYGVHEVFDNVIRAALLARRQQRFWMTNLKHVQRPLLQEPFCPPKPPSCELTSPPSQFEEDMLRLCRSQAYTDVIFVAGSVGFSAHRFVLAAVSPTFHSLLTTDLSANLGSTASNGRARSASDSSVASSLEASVGNFNLDTEQLLGSGRGSEKSSATATMRASFHLPRGLSSASNNNNDQDMDTALPPPGHLHESSAELIRQPLNHVAFSSIAIEHCEGLDHRGKVTSSLQTVVTMSSLISPTSFQHALRFLYTGSLDLQMCINLPELLATAEYLEVSDLRSLVTNIQHREEFLNSDLRNSYLKKVQQCLKEFCLDQGMFSDVLFQLDDGQCAAHRPILMARCEVMAAMFKGNFRESDAKVIQFPGVTRECFQQMLVYIYTDELELGVGPNNCLPLIALANRLCLPRLVSLVEQRVVASLVSTDSTEQALRLLEPCQLHNADQLADWFLYHIAINYNDICRKSPKLLRNLHPENQAYLNRNRWPPIWYLKEFDFYERCMRERLWQEKPPKLFKRQHNNGCLCFSGGKKRAYRTV